MSKKQMIAAMTATSGITKAAAEAALTGLTDYARGCIEAGETFDLAGVVKIAVKDTPARQVRNPATGALIDKPAGRKAVAKASKTLDALLS